MHESLRHFGARRELLAWLMGIAAAVACGTMPEARAEAGASREVAAHSIVVDGTDWMQSTSRERRAFLVGVANLIVAEGAYAKRRNGELPVVSARIVKAVADLRLTDIEARITSWYEANPAQNSMPVMGVIWRDIVGARSEGGTER